MRRDILSGSRTARLNANLVLSGQAYTASMVQAYPGDKHACAALLYALPVNGVSLERMRSLLGEQLDDLAERGADACRAAAHQKGALCCCWHYWLALVVPRVPDLCSMRVAFDS